MSVRMCVGWLLSVSIVVLFVFLITGGGSVPGVMLSGNGVLPVHGGRTSGSIESAVPAVGVEASFPSAPCGSGTVDEGARSARVTEDWLRKVEAQIEREEYNASVNERGLQAPNRAHNLRTYFREAGIKIVPRTGEAPDAWTFSWRTLGWGREGRLMRVTGASIKPRANGPRVTYVREGLQEWYENKKEGLEQGFIVSERPEGEGFLCIEGSIGGGLRAELHAEDGAIDLFDAGDARVLRYAELHVRDAGGREVPSYLKVEGDRVVILVDDASGAYPLTVDPLMSSPAWIAEYTQTGDWFGWSVGTAGDVNGDGFSDVIVGAHSTMAVEGVPMFTMGLPVVLGWAQPGLRRATSRMPTSVGRWARLET